MSDDPYETGVLCEHYSEAGFCDDCDKLKAFAKAVIELMHGGPRDVGSLTVPEVKLLSVNLVADIASVMTEMALWRDK